MPSGIFYIRHFRKNGFSRLSKLFELLTYNITANREKHKVGTRNRRVAMTISTDLATWSPVVLSVKGSIMSFQQMFPLQLRDS